MPSEAEAPANKITVEIVTGRQRNELLAQAITETLIQKLTGLRIGLRILKSSMLSTTENQTRTIEQLEQLLKQASSFTLATREVLLAEDNQPLHIDHKYEGYPMISLDSININS